MSAVSALYDWGGANAGIAVALNGHVPEAVAAWLPVVMQWSAKAYFPYYLVAVLAVGLLDIVWRLLRGSVAKGRHAMGWLGVWSVLVLGYWLMDAALVEIIQRWPMARPYVELAAIQRIGGEPANPHASFPAGQVVFMTLVVAALWPKLHGLLAFLAVLTVGAVMVCCVAMGINYPADVVAGGALGLLLVWIVRYPLYKLCRIPYY